MVRQEGYAVHGHENPVPSDQRAPQCGRSAGERRQPHGCHGVDRHGQRPYLALQVERHSGPPIGFRGSAPGSGETASGCGIQEGPSHRKERNED